MGYIAHCWVVLGEDGGTHQRVGFVLARCWSGIGDVSRSDSQQNPGPLGAFILGRGNVGCTPCGGSKIIKVKGVRQVPKTWAILMEPKVLVSALEWAVTLRRMEACPDEGVLLKTLQWQWLVLGMELRFFLFVYLRQSTPGCPWTHCVSFDHLEILSFLPPPSQGWNYRCSSPYLADVVLGIKPRSSCELSANWALIFLFELFFSTCNYCAL